MGKAASVWLVLLMTALAALGGLWWWLTVLPDWTEAERAQIAALSLSRLPDLPADPSNRFADDPRAVALGEALFSDTRLSAEGTVSCASCHVPESQFQDNALPGTHVGATVRRTMPLAGVAYSPFLFWDGRRDSLWAQALDPLEHPQEHATDRMAVARLVASAYRAPYEALFGAMPDLSGLPLRASPRGDAEAMIAWEGLDGQVRAEVDRIFVNLGKAIGAFERTIMPRPGRFDEYADAVGEGREEGGLLNASEIAGLRVFVGQGACIQCHNGPLLSDGHFHNTGVPEGPGLPRDMGRIAVLEALLTDPFNCLGAFSDAGPRDCGELRFMAGGDAMIRAFKTPSLRGVAGRAPYMHAGQLASLAEVVEHYNFAPWAPFGLSEVHPLGLSVQQLADLEAFLETL